MDSCDLISVTTISHYNAALTFIINRSLVRQPDFCNSLPCLFHLFGKKHLLVNLIKTWVYNNDWHFAFIEFLNSLHNIKFKTFTPCQESKICSVFFKRIPCIFNLSVYFELVAYFMVKAGYAHLIKSCSCAIATRSEYPCVRVPIQKCKDSSCYSCQYFLTVAIIANDLVVYIPGLRIFISKPKIVNALQVDQCELNPLCYQSFWSFANKFKA